MKAYAGRTTKFVHALFSRADPPELPDVLAGPVRFPDRDVGAELQSGMTRAVTKSPLPASFA